MYKSIKDNTQKINICEEEYDDIDFDKLWENMNHDTRCSLLKSNFFEPRNYETLYLEFDNNSNIILKNSIGVIIFDNLSGNTEIITENNGNHALYIDCIKKYNIKH